MTFITILIFLLAAAAVLIYLKQTKAQKDVQKAKRRPGRGLVLSREPHGKKKANQLTAPLILGAVVLTLSGWVAASYFLGQEPGEAKPEPADKQEARSIVADSPTSKSISVKIDLNQDDATQATGQAVISKAATEAAAQAETAVVSESQNKQIPKNNEPVLTQTTPAEINNLNNNSLSPNTAKGQASGNKNNGQSASTEKKNDENTPNNDALSAPVTGKINNGKPDKNESKPNIKANQASDSRKEPITGTKGQSTSLANAKKPTEAPKPTTNEREIVPSSDTREYTVHLGSFLDKANAEQYKEKLASAGEPASISTIKVDKQIWYRVTSGQFSSQNAANVHGMDLKRRGLTTSSGNFVVKPIN